MRARQVLAAALKEADPYGHLASIHNCEKFYDYSRDWITHCSCQREDHHKTTELTDDLRERYGKPVIWDEVGCEGDFPHCWGNFTPEELTRRAWEAALRGGYCGHGETYLSKDDSIWWAHGGKLKGDSAPRFRFLLEFLEDVPGCGLTLAKLRDDVHFQWDDYVAVPEEPAYSGDYYFFYYSIWRPSFRQIWIDDKDPRFKESLAGEDEKVRTFFDPALNPILPLGLAIPFGQFGDADLGQGKLTQGMLQDVVAAMNVGQFGETDPGEGKLTQKVLQNVMAAMKEDKES